MYSNVFVVLLTAIGFAPTNAGILDPFNLLDNINIFDTFKIAGRPTEISFFPYTVSIRTYGMHKCSGALISPNAVVTAAHCVENPSTEIYTLQFGATHRHPEEGEVRHVSFLKAHPAYNEITFANDVAVLRVAEPALTMRETVAVVALPKRGAWPRPGDMGWVTGWEVQNLLASDKSMKLRGAQVPVWEKGDCEVVNKRNHWVIDGVFCAGLIKDRKDACQADDGGPYVVDGILYGIVSHGRQCGGMNEPGVYTNVVNFLGFINKFANLKNFDAYSEE